MRATGPVLLLVALAGCQSVLSASLEFAANQDVSDERVEIGDLQKSDEPEPEAELKGERMVLDHCFGEAERDQPEQRSKPTASSSSEEMTDKIMSTKQETTEAKEIEAKAEVRVQTLDSAEEDSDEAEERFDIELLKHAGERDAAVE